MWHFCLGPCHPVSSMRIPQFESAFSWTSFPKGKGVHLKSCFCYGCLLLKLDHLVVSFFAMGWSHCNGDNPTVLNFKIQVWSNDEMAPAKGVLAWWQLTHAMICNFMNQPLCGTSKAFGLFYVRQMWRGMQHADATRSPPQKSLWRVQKTR